MTEYNLTLGQAIDLLNQGKKIIGNHCNEIYLFKNGFNARWHFVDNDQDATDFVLNENMLNTKFAIYEPKQESKLITWYRPIVLFDKNGDRPFIDDDYFSDFYKSKQEFFDEHGKDKKVLEWEEKYFPETWEDCE